MANLKGYVSREIVLALGAKKSNQITALPTGEFRRPCRGEWYLSGAIVEAYQAPNDLTQKFHIARLVLIER